MTVLESGETHDAETFHDAVTGDGGAAAFLECGVEGAELSGLR